MVIKTIIFDLSGVFVSDAPLYYKNHLCDFSNVLDFAGVSEELTTKLWKKHWSKLKYGQERIEIFWNEFEPLITTGVKLKEVIKQYEDKIILDQEVFDFAKKLNLNYCLLALANESKDGIDLKIRKFNLNDLFKKIYCSANLNMAKPNKNIYEYVIKNSKIEIETTVFIDNQIANIETARTLGIKSILFKNLEQLKNNFKDLGIIYCS